MHLIQMGVGAEGLPPHLQMGSDCREFYLSLMFGLPLETSSIFCFVLVFVIVGVAIMLRVKIDPRTVMTIQNQIQNLLLEFFLLLFLLQSQDSNRFDVCIYFSDIWDNFRDSQR